MSYPRKAKIISVIRTALKEDTGKRDITTELVIPKDTFAKAIILAKKDCVVCGLGVAGLVFKTKDKKLQFKSLVKDGQSVKKGKILARVQGKASSILTAERVALNFLGLLSGIATKASSYVNAVKADKTKIMDTRKTIPGLRELQKYAVRVGGGYNHRMKLDEMVLIKDNHLKIINPRSQIQGLKNVIRRIKNRVKGIKIEVEVKNLREFKAALECKPDIIMLDNMKIADMKRAVEIKRHTPYAKRYTLLEASGSITLKNVKRFASAGVDMISAGDLTHSVSCVDISLEIL